MESKHLPIWWVLLLCKKWGKISYSYYYFVDKRVSLLYNICILIFLEYL